MDYDKLEKRKEFVKKELFGELFEEEFDKVEDEREGGFEDALEENFEDPKNSDIMYEKQSTPDDKDGEKRPRV